MTVLTENTDVKQETNTTITSGEPAKETTGAAAPEDKTSTTGEKAPDASTKPAEKSPANEGDKPKEEVKGAPEKYEEFKLPEGIAIIPEMLNKFTTVAKEMNLTQEQAQKLIELTSENAIEKNKAQEAALNQQKATWVKALKEDKEYGGDKYNETVERAKRTFKTFGSEELGKTLDESMLGDHPAFIKFFAEVDKKIGEDKIVDGKPSKSEGKSAAQTLYGK